MPIVSGYEKPAIIEEKPIYETPIAVGARRPYDTLVAFSSAMRWMVDFYLAIQGKDTEPTSFQLDLPATWCQLQLIKNFELLVNAPLTHQQNTDNQRGFTSTGTAKCYSVITPNVGDVFITSMLDGEKVLFIVTDVVRETIYKESFCTINYKISRRVDQVLLDNLGKKVVDTKYFDRNNYRNGIRPILDSNEVEQLRKLDATYNRLGHLYLKDFYSERVESLVLPDQPSITYDPFMVNFVRRTFDPGLFHKMLQVTQYDVSYRKETSVRTVLDVLCEMDYPELSTVARYIGTTDIHAFKTSFRTRTVYFTMIQRIVAMQDTISNVNPQTGGADDIVLSESNLRNGDTAKIFTRLNLTEDPVPKEVQWITPIYRNPTYIFSNNFYQGIGYDSIIEHILYERLVNNRIDLKLLADLSDQAMHWSNLERFYYIPIVMMLIKISRG